MYLSKNEPANLDLTPNGRTRLSNVAPAIGNNDVPNKVQMTDAIAASSNGGGSVFPTSPLDYQKFFLIPDGDNLDGKLYTWNGSTWV